VALAVGGALAASAQEVTWVGSGSNANWSTAANWTQSGSGGLWASGTGVNVTIGSIGGSGTSVQNRTENSGGVRVGGLTLASETPFTIVGSPIYLNGRILSTGSAPRTVAVQLNLQQPTTEINVAAGSGRLTLGNLSKSGSAAVAAIRKTGDGELLMTGFWGSTGSASTFSLEAGTVSLAAAPRFGYQPPASVALGSYGNNSFTAGVLRLEGGGLRAAVTGTTPFGPQYFIAGVTQDTILSGSAVTLGDPSGAMNARLGFYSGFRVDADSRLTLHNEAVLSRHISGTAALTVSGSGRLTLQGTGSTTAPRIPQLTVDGGGVGLTSMSLVGLPSAGIALVNGGRLDSLTGFTLGGTTGQKVVIGSGGGVLRSASPMSMANLNILDGGLEGGGTLRVEATQPLLPPNMPAGYYIQPGRIVISGSNPGFTGAVVVNGGELQVRSLAGLGSALLAGGTQAIAVQAGILNVSGTAWNVVVTPDLSRVTVSQGATLKLMSAGSFTLTAATAPATPIAGMLGLESTTLSGSGMAVRLADGAIVQNAGMSGVASVRADLAYASAGSGTITLAGAYVPNRRAVWGGELGVFGQLTREAGAGALDLVIKGTGVVMNVAQNTFAGLTTVDNGRLVLQHVNGLGGPGRTVLVKPGAQVDLNTTFTSATSLPTFHPSSAGMIGIGTSVSGTVVQAMARGNNSIGPSYYADYTYSLGSLPAVGGVYRFGSVTAPVSINQNVTMAIPRSFTITQPNVLTGSASVVVGAVRGDAFGTAGSALTMRANQDYTGGTIVRKDFFLAVDQPLTAPFGSGPVVVQGALLATGSAGSFANASGISSQVTFAKGGELWLNNASGVNANRWGDTTPIVIDAGAVRMSGNSSLAVSETVGTLSYAAGSRIFMEAVTSSGSAQPSLTLQSLAPQAGTRPTLEIFRSSGLEKVFVTQTPTTVGAANLVPGGFDRRINAFSGTTNFLARDPATQELVAATPTISGTSFASSTAADYVNLSGPTTLAASGTALAVRTMSNIMRTGSTASLTIGDGTIGQLMVNSPYLNPSMMVTSTVSPDLTFAGDGIIFTGSGAKAMLTGLVTATSGIVKMGPGDLVLSNTTAVGGVGSQQLVVREGRLSGNGSRMWNVIIEGSGVFAPGNSPAVTEVGGLTMGSETRNEFELTALDDVSDKIVVAGDLTLDGIIDIIDWEPEGPGTGGTMEIGTYDLITWGGNLIDNGVELGVLPDGYFGQLFLNLERKVLEFQVLNGVAVVPEPAGLALLAAGLPALAWWHRRRSRAGR
jgi:autotransporter-associated beta strand protein